MRQFCFKSCFVLIVCCLHLPLSAIAQINCDTVVNKFLSSGYFIENTTCGAVNGRIILFTPIDPSKFTFVWTPNVSDNNVAENLGAGFYHIKISLDSIPSCVLDTFFYVNNSDGPDFNVNILATDTASCSANDGTLSLIPADPNANLTYVWMNGLTGNTLSQIPSDTFIVTITNQVTGCFGIEQIIMPSKNPLVVNTFVEKYPKCGKPIGQVGVYAAGGSGDYLYNGNNTPIYQDLAAGSYTFTVLDQSTQCTRSVGINLPDLNVSGALAINPHAGTCPGNATGGNNNPGFVEFQVTPGDNFRMPFTYNIIDGNGGQFQPDILPGGLYELQITDADGCNLPVKTFFVGQPDDFALSPLPEIKPETNLELGSILLNITGGTGDYRIDWADLPGTDNPKDRVNLNAGLYKAILYDESNCAFQIGPYTIAASNPKIDTIHLFVAKGTSQAFCPVPPTGVSLNGASYALINGQLTGYSTQGAWTLQAGNGCLNYQANGTAGGAPDLVFIRQTVPSNNALDLTYCVLVTITSVPTTFENVYFDLPAASSGTFCGNNIPSGFTNFAVVPVAVNGLNGPLGQYGNYQVDPATACLNFQSSGITGYNVDKICVGVYAPAQNRCHIICYWPSIQPANGCLNDLIPSDTIQLVTDSCTVPATFCLDIPYDQINDFAILDNGTNYSGSFIPCGFDSIRLYKAEQWPVIGPYALQNWQIGGQQFSGTFQNLEGLVQLMNQLDMGGNWSLNANRDITGGIAGSSYGGIAISNTLGTQYALQPEIKVLAQKTALQLMNGVHRLRFYNLATACSDSLKVTVTCTGCPSFFSYLPDSTGLITVSADACDGQFPFCTTIPFSQILQYEIKKGASDFSEFSACSNLIALSIDTGLQQLSIREKATNCTQQIKVKVNCTPPGIGELIANPDHYIRPLASEITMPILENDIIFGILANQAGLNTVEIIRAPKLGGVTFFANEGIFKYFPASDCGIDTFTYTLRDTLGRESIAQVILRIYCDKLFVFNGISPNGDNLNDNWKIIGIDDYPNNEVSVYNRWGALVFKQRNYQNTSAWDAQLNGKSLPDGTYFYLIDLGDGDPVIKGNLQILR